ncbi:MAG: polysulfide reductase NrfD [Candidatus Tectomicrobia bacterium]|uniref:Polysulfide reductase NrfD n=1 Tax=Tectimicrobiota bacterium TaxID=2528274 RepID=A0A932HVS4_UNCTE|nr:polysulfide reductase NrfD [Candidatus Tectomicrobia bacterium]
MEPIVLMQTKWGATFNIPWYLFLGGMSGGILIIAACAELFGGRNPRFQALAGLSALLNLPFMVIGGLALTFHLGKPERGFFFPIFMTNYHSWLVIGGWIIGIFVPASIAMAMAWYYEVRRSLRMILAIVSLPLGVAMCFYTGILLSEAQFVPLWAWQFLPVLFLLSGLSTGLAACAINAYVVKFLPFPARARDRIQRAGLEETAPLLGLIDVAVLLLELLWLFLFIAALNNGAPGHRLAAYMLTKGELSHWFWVGVVTIGLVLPLALSLLESLLKKLLRREEGWAVGWPLFCKLHLVLLGGIILRYVIVWGGDIKQPLIFPSQQAQVPMVSGQGSPESLGEALRMINRR